MFEPIHHKTATLPPSKSIGRPQLHRGALTSAAIGFFLLGAVSNLIAQGSQSFIPSTIKEFQTAGQTTFVVPTNVTKILAQLWGAGGGGGSVSSNSTLPAGGNGGVGAYSCRVLTVTAGNTLVITLGTGGSGALSSSNSGFAGGNSSITVQNSVTLLTAGGGDAVAVPMAQVERQEPLIRTHR